MTCKVCANKLFNSFFKKGKYEYITCKNCGLGMLTPEESNLSQKKYQSRSYFTDLAKPKKNHFTNFLFNIRFFPKYSSWVDSSRLNSQNKILDIGCGNGEFLKEMQELGWDVSGLDISTVAVKNTNHLLGSKVAILGNPSSKIFKSEFPIITMWHALEHVPSPDAYIKSIKNIIAREGELFVEVPNYDSFILFIFKPYYSWLMLPEHATYFSKKSLETLFTNNNFKIIDIYTPPRCLLNFAYSLENKFHIYYLFFAPVSIIVALVASLFKKGEVIRVHCISK